MVELTNEEIDIFKRGRNFNYKDKSEAYINASGYEALIGYLYLNKEVERLNYLLKRTIELVEKHE